MNLRKHIQFSRIIKAGGRLKEFNFLKLFNTEKPTYYVDVSVPDEGGKRYFFSLFNDGKIWKICGEGLPEWLLQVEAMLRGEVSAQEVEPA
jgi:hypothetical protein